MPESFCQPLLDQAVLYGDCLEVMPKLEAASVQLVLADLPYGITNNTWDSQIDLEQFWLQAIRVLADPGAIVLTASQPFTSKLVMSNLPMFKHEWIWLKNRGSNFANTIREPMKEHEAVLVFARGNWIYNRQMQPRAESGLARAKYLVEHNSQVREGTRKFEGRPPHQIGAQRVPSSWQKFNIEVGLHPTQKPVDLFRYLIRTYTNPGDTVLDPCAGSGTTGIAAREEGRKWILIENNRDYYEKCLQRMRLSSASVTPG